MYQFSRSIYRDLAPRVVEDPRDPTGVANKQQVLEACEGAIRRLTADRRYFARPARTLFNEIRFHFGMADQERVWDVVECSMTLAVEYLEKLPADLDLDGRPRECRAHTRRGTPCQRQPLPGRDYCPSHKHLEETFVAVEAPVEALASELIAV